MKRIIKSQEPNSFLQHRASQSAYYDNLSRTAKEELRESLLYEQGHICCYCLKRIPEKVENDGRISYGMKVEHYQCQAHFPELQLNYSNLLGVCTGNEGKPKKLQTCDTRKGNEVLTINLLCEVPNCESLFKYNAEGEISSANDDENINKQLNDVLNLNMQTLKDGRREVYLEVQRHIETEGRRIGNRQLRITYFEQERDRWLTLAENKLKPFCMIAVYYLNKKIRQNQN